MTDDSFTKAIQELEILFAPNDFCEKNISHGMDILGKELKQIDDTYQSFSIDQKRRLIIQLKSFEINLFRRWASSLSELSLRNLIHFLPCRINMDMLINRDVNDSYFDLSLNYLTTETTLDYLSGNQPTNSIDEEFLFFFCAIGRHAIYNMKFLSYSIISLIKTPTFFQYNDKNERLLRGLLAHINRWIRNGSLSDGQLEVFYWIQNMIDIVPFVPYFVQTGYPSVILQWLSIEQNDITINMETWTTVLSILGNLARHELGVQALNQHQAIPILKTWKDRYLSESTLPINENDDNVLTIFYMIYALLLDPVVLKQEDLTYIHLALNHILDQTIQAFESNYFKSGSLSTEISEYLTVLTRFAVNDKCLLYILKYDHIFDLFVQKFLDYNQLFLTNTDVDSTDLNILICSLLYNIFWSISFQSEYHDLLKSNMKFVQFVQQIAKIKGNDEYIVRMRESANGILFNLDLVEQFILQNQSQIKNDIDGLKVMVSYSHKDSTFCRSLVNILQNRVKGDIWVDFIKLEPPYEDDWEEIAEAITRCDVVVMIVTEYYCGSKSCRREVIHADKRNKQMIPIYQGKQYQPDDWFEIRAGSTTWVRFGGQKSDDEVIETLIELINAQEKAKKQSNKIAMHQKPDLGHNLIGSSVSNTTTAVEVLPLPPHPLSPPNTSLPTVISRKPIEQWTNEEVQQWLHLSPSILHLSSGHALLAYASLMTHEEAQHDEYEQNLRNRGLTREQFANLISSLVSLRSLHNVESTSAKPPEQWTKDEVKYWFEQNHLSTYLMETFAFVDGIELITYAKMLIVSSLRMDTEYDRLRTRIETRYNGQVLLQLDEYTRLVSALKKLIERAKLTFQLNDDAGSCTIV
ncbi:unnamed protein product [Rotaria sp. Silwood2]|nr:unnamed protein product [Rotaria sp. Silwood2]